MARIRGQHHLEVFFPHQSLLHQHEFAVKQRLGEGLAPGAGGANKLSQLKAELIRQQFTVGEQYPGQQLRGHQLADHHLEGAAKSLDIGLGQGQPRRHGVAAKLAHQARMAGIEQFEGIAQMHAGNGAPRALELGLAALGKRDHRPVVLLLHLGSHQPHYPLMPLVSVQHYAGGHLAIAKADLLQGSECLLLHPLLYLLALLVEAVHLGGELARQIEILAEQTGDSEGHVIEPAHGVEARPQREAEIGGGEAATIAARHVHQRLDAGTAATSADPLQPLMHQDAVVAIQRHHVGDGAERHQIQIIRHIGGTNALALIPAQLAQVSVEGRHQIEGHPHPGQGLGGEVAAMLVGVHYRIGSRQLLARQVMIGDQNLHAGRLGRRHPGDAGDAVVHRDEELGAARHRQLDYLRGQAIAEFETVGHQKIDVVAAHCPQRQHAQGRAGGAVAVKISDDEDALLGGQRRCQQGHRLLHAEQALGRQQLAGAALEQGRILYPPAGKDLTKQWVQSSGQMGIINSRTTTDLQGH